MGCQLSFFIARTNMSITEKTLSTCHEIFTCDILKSFTYHSLYIIWSQRGIANSVAYIDLYLIIPSSFMIIGDSLVSV